MRSGIAEVASRLDGVIIENQPWERCISVYDSKDSFLFCDPPYVGTQQKSYASWSLEEFERLVETLREAEGGWLLTINDGKETRRVLRGLKVRPVSRARGIAQGKMRELLVTPK